MSMDASAEPTGLSQVEPVSRLDPTGFDPLRWTPRTIAVWREYSFGDHRIFKTAFHGSWHFADKVGIIYTDAMLQDVMAFADSYLSSRAGAIAMEARSGETGTGSTRKGDSAAIAQ